MNTLSKILLVGCLFVMSCKQDDFNEVQIENNILEFISIEDAYNFAQHSMNLSSNELKEKESNLGFISHARKSDKLIENLNDDHFTSSEAMLSAIGDNADFLRISEEEGELYIEKQIDGLSSFFLNEERIVKIGDEYFKGFSNGLLKSPDLNSLLSYDDIKFDVDKFENNSFLQRYSRSEILKTEDTQNDCGTSAQGQTTNGSERTRVYVDTTVEDWGSGYAPNQYRYYVIHKVRPFKQTFGIWNSVKRTMKGYFSVRFDFINNGYWDARHSVDYFTNVYDNEYRKAYNVAELSLPNIPFHLGGYYIWGDTPSTGYADKVCNEELVCNTPFLPGPSGWITCVEPS